MLLYCMVRVKFIEKILLILNQIRSTFTFCRPRVLTDNIILGLTPSLMNVFIHNMIYFCYERAGYVAFQKSNFNLVLFYTQSSQISIVLGTYVLVVKHKTDKVKHNIYQSLIYIISLL